MADNVAITAGAGTSVATDDIGGVQFQRVKLAVGPDGTHTADLAGRVVTGSDGAIYVDPRRKHTRVQVTPTITAGAYTSGDILGGQLTFANAVRAGALSGRIVSVTVLDKTQAQRAPMDLVLFDRSVTVPADNAVATFSDADMANCLGVINFSAQAYNTAWAGTPANSIATIPYSELTTSATVNSAAQLPFPIVLNSTDLYVAVVLRSSPTYTSTSDIVISLTIEQD